MPSRPTSWQSSIPKRLTLALVCSTDDSPLWGGGGLRRREVGEDRVMKGLIQCSGAQLSYYSDSQLTPLESPRSSQHLLLARGARRQLRLSMFTSRVSRGGGGGSPIVCGPHTPCVFTVHPPERRRFQHRAREADHWLVAMDRAGSEQRRMLLPLSVAHAVLCASGA